MFTVSIKTVTLCSNVMSAMSVSKKSDNSEGRMQNNVSFSSKTKRFYYALTIACHFISSFFSS